MLAVMPVKGGVTQRLLSPGLSRVTRSFGKARLSLSEVSAKFERRPSLSVASAVLQSHAAANTLLARLTGQINNPECSLVPYRTGVQAGRVMMDCRIYGFILPIA